MRFTYTILFVGIVLTALFGLLGWRVYDLQGPQHRQYQQENQAQQSALVKQQGQRGFVVDCRGRVLAASNVIDEVFIEPRRLAETDDIKETSDRLKTALNYPGLQICRMVSESKNPGFVRICSQITPLQRQAVVDAKIPGVGVQTVWQRYYPIGRLTSHLVGFVGTDRQGLSGLELRYDSVLAGQAGRQVYQVDVLRRPIGYRPDLAIASTDGQSIILTIDATIQQFTRSALLKQINEFQAESAVAIVMDPKTGAIAAMVSLPDYDPDDFSKTPPDNLKNCVLADPYEPGSIIKPIVAAIALDNGAVGFDEVFDCEDGYWGKYRIGEFGSHRYGLLSVRNILVNSSNIGMAKIGIKLGRKRLYEGMKLFGFGTKTGADLPGEDAGLLWPVSKWSGYSVTRIPFGHEVLATSLQMIRAYCILANGGSTVTPHIVKAVVDSEGGVCRLREGAGGTGYIIKPEVAHWIVQNALVGVVNEGTGDQARLENCQVWGKTGTANIALSSGGYDTTNYVSSFIGGAPAENPKLVVLVSIRKPKKSLGKGYSGGRVAAPVAREILEKTINYLSQAQQGT